MNNARKTWNVLDEFLEFINSIIRIFCVIALAGMTLIVMIQVFTRMIPWIKVPTWTEELARYAMIYVAFIGASNGIRRWNNINVDFIFTRLPRIPRLIVDIIIHLTILVFWCLVVYWGYIYFPKVGGKQYSASMGFPMLYAQMSILIGGVLCILQTIGSTINLLIGGGKDV